MSDAITSPKPHPEAQRAMAQAALAAVHGLAELLVRKGQLEREAVARLFDGLATVARERRDGELEALILVDYATAVRRAGDAAERAAR
jgi:hypothetical protein